MAALYPTMKKLMLALNTKGYNLTVSTKQFIGRDNKTRNIYIISNAVWDDEKRRWENQPIYSTSGLVRIVLFLRDMWFAENGWDLPMDNEVWNKLREEIKEEIENGQHRTRFV